MSLMVTIGEIETKLKESIFPEDSEDEFVKKCHERESLIKQNLIKAFEFINLNIEQPGINYKLNYWQEDRINRNIENFIKYIEFLFNKLNKLDIENRCRNTSYKFQYLSEKFDVVFINNSFYGSVVLDIMWASDLSVVDAINISKGELNQEDLIKKLPQKVRVIEKEIKLYLSKSNRYRSFYPIFREAVLSFNKKYYKGCNLLLLVLIEGLVRSLGEFLIEKQELGKEYLMKEYQSLDSYLRNIPWKNDFIIEPIKLSLITGNVEFLINEKLNEDKPLEINLKTRLDFLRRRFKQDRDLIIHGIDNNYGSPWQLFLNFSSLQEVILTVRYYNEKYS